MDNRKAWRLSLGWPNTGVPAGRGTTLKYSAGKFRLQKSEIRLSPDSTVTLSEGR